jgi:hypothetical protein
MRTYVAGAYTTSGGSTNNGASDERAINTSTRCVRDDCEVSVHKDRTNGGAAWEM